MARDWGVAGEVVEGGPSRRQTLSINTQIKGLDVLRHACAELGLMVVDNAEARDGASRMHAGEHVMQIKGSFDIAVFQTSGLIQLEATVAATLARGVESGFRI